jgi:hypothetical protein
MPLPDTLPERGYTDELIILIITAYSSRPEPAEWDNLLPSAHLQNLREPQFSSYIRVSFPS